MTMMKLINEPMKHQISAIQFGLAHHYAMNCDEMGLGKTFEFIGEVVAVKQPTLVVCPAFLRKNWEKEFNTHVDGCRIKLISSPKEARTTLHTLDKFDVVISSYSQLKHLRDYFKWASVVGADEAHYLKNMEASRTRLFHANIRNYTPDRLKLLTGTPVRNRVPDFYSLLSLCGHSPQKTNGKNIKDKFKSSYQFNEYFSNPRVFKINHGGRQVRIRTYEGVKNEAELKSYFKYKYIRRLAKDVLDLDDMQDVTAIVDYKAESSDLRNAWDTYTGKVDDHMMRVKAETALLKTKYTIDYVKNIATQDGSVVIFTDHVESAKQIASKLDKSGLITGSVHVDSRQPIVDAFQKGDLKYIVLTIGAGSTGLTLTKSRHVVFNDLSWVPSDNEQASKRIHRIGQTKKCMRHFIVGGYTDEKIANNLLEKMKTINKIVGG